MSNHEHFSRQPGSVLLVHSSSNTVMGYDMMYKFEEVDEIDDINRGMWISTCTSEIEEFGLHLVVAVIPMPNKMTASNYDWPTWSKYAQEVMSNFFSVEQSYDCVTAISSCFCSTCLFNTDIVLVRSLRDRQLRLFYWNEHIKKRIKFIDEY